MQYPTSPLPRSPSPLPLANSPSPVHLPSSPTTEKTSRRSNDVPWRLMLPILLYRIADAATYVVIFPFITDMVTSFNVSPDRIGLYSGLGEGTLMIVEAIAAPTWARLADKYGRRPALFWGFLLCVCPAAAVGFSSRVWHIILWRALFGLNPIGVVAKIQASELCHPGNRAKVFSIFSPSFAVGGMIGTLLGGELAHPYGRLPWWLGGTAEVWRRWPYALPCVSSWALGIFASIVGWFTLVETKVPDEGHKIDDAERANEKRPNKVSYAAAMRVPNFMLITVGFCMFQITTMSWDAVFVIYTYTSVRDGGLGLPIDYIGLIMSVTSLSYIFLTPYFLPRLEKRFGGSGTLRRVLMVWPLLSLSLPLGTRSAKSFRPGMWLVIACQQISKCFGNFAWPLNEMLTMASFDDYPHLLATGSAVSLIAGAAGRAIGPAVSGWIYSASTQYEEGSWGRQISWLGFLALTVPPLILSRLLPTEERQKEGYETVPLNDRPGDEEDDVDVVRASAREV